MGRAQNMDYREEAKQQSFSKITPLSRYMAYLQMRHREDAKDAKLREEENKS